MVQASPPGNPPRPDAAGPRLAGQTIQVAMRFSYLGLSGWQSEFSKDREKLFETSRLEHRLRLLDGIALASLEAQADQNFHLIVLTSADLPDWAMARLTGLCAARLGQGRFTILPRPPGRARKHLREFLKSRFSAGKVVQMVLDDDDGLATDFLQTLRSELQSIDADRELAERREPYFISCIDGFGLVFGSDPDAMPLLYRHRYPFINLGLCMIAAPDGENLFSIDHQASPRKYGATIIKGQPMFVRSLHGLNDSRATPSDRWTELPDWPRDADVAQRFPYLLRL